MKKLMKAVTAAAVALVASSSFASLPSPTEGALGFEAFTAGKYTVSDFVEMTDEGQTGSGNSRYWYAITNASQDASAELATIVEGGAAGGNKYLAIEAQAPLYRTINASGNWGPELSDVTAEDIPASGIYLDTMVKFTVSSDEFKDGDLDIADKLAITCYSADDSGATNIIVRAGYVGSSVVATNYVMTLPANFDVDAWHRLTVRAIADVGSSTAPVGFAVYLDQTLLTYGNDVAAGGAAYVGDLNAAVTQNLYNSTTHALLPSLVTTGVNKSKLTAVGFKGTGSLDDIQFTNEKPSFIVEGIAVSIAWDANVATYTVVDSNNKTLVDAAATSGAAGSTNLTLDAGVTALTVTATYANGYEAGTWTVTGDGAQISGSAFTVANGAELSIVSMLPKFDVGETHYGTFADALAAAVAAGTPQSPATVKLLAACNEMIKFTTGTIILDLGGYDIKGTADETYSLVNQGAQLIITNSVPATGAVKRPVESEDTAGAMQLKGDAGVTKVYDTKFEDVITVKPDSVAKTAIFEIYSGTFYDADANNDSTAFAYNAYIKNEANVIALGNNYFQVGGEAPLTGWAAVLGKAIAENTYGIDNLTELKAFQANIASTTNELKLATAGLTFKLTADIALDEPWSGIGVQNGKDIYSTADFNAAAFQGTFDGQNRTISGFQMIGKGNNAEGLDYCGFFNSTYGATIQNLKIQYAGSLFAADTTASTKESGATFVGVAKNSTLKNLTTLAGTVSCSKGFGGVVGYLVGTTVDSCTNNVNMTSLANNKCGGIAMICQQSGCAISNCVNNGTITTESSNGEFGGILGYTDTITIYNCQNTAAYKMFYHHGGTVTLDGVIKGNATVASYTGNATSGLNFATVDGSVATFVADGALAAGNTYKVMATGATATFEFAAAGTIAFDTNLVQDVTFDITAPGLDLTDATANGVVTFTAAAPAPADWVDPSTITPGAKASEVYTDLAETALANADATKLTQWATDKKVNFSDVKTAPATFEDAFLLNCAAIAEAVAAAKENFKLDITVNADGSVTVTAPKGYNVEPKIEGKQSLSDKTWHDKTEGDQFFRAVLDL